MATSLLYSAAYYQFSNKHHGTPTRIRLVMFGFAGGRIAALTSLAKQLPSWIEVWGAEYPGRGLRWKTEVLSSVQPMLDDLRPGLQALCDRPVVLFGYSMGANIAYRLGLDLPGRILGLIAASAPQPGQRALDWSKHSDQRLLNHFESLGGIPLEILSNQTIMDAFLPVVRADLACCLDMSRLESASLVCPVLVMNGNSDPMIRTSEASLWLKSCSGRPGRSMHKVYPGGHFFHHGSEEIIALDIADWLSKLICNADYSNNSDTSS